jgi:hypothetical protein
MGRFNPRAMQDGKCGFDTMELPAALRGESKPTAKSQVASPQARVVSGISLSTAATTISPKTASAGYGLA